MALISFCFRELIETSIEPNSNGLYGENDTIGVNIDKVIRKMKGDASRKELSTFFIVHPGDFVYNPRGSRKLGLGYNDTDATYITTFNNVVFRIKKEAQDLVLPRYLYMYLSRKEWDRRAECNSWGTSTEVFSWNTFCEMRIDLPNIWIQEKYVNLYEAILANQQSYERGLEDLKLVCDGYIEDLRRTLPSDKIGKYLIWSDQRNNCGLSVDAVRGLSTGKEMIPTKANMDGVGLDSYKTVMPGQIAYVPDTSRRGDKISLGFNNTQETFLVSSIYTVFGTDAEHLVPEYLMLFLTRTEFDRYARFNSWGSARETFDWDEMCSVEIPIPEIKVQKAIAEVFSVYRKRKKINEQLKSQIKDICPILIKGSLEDTK